MGTMDKLCIHYMAGMVRESLARACFDGFTVWRIDDLRCWFNLGWFFRFLEGRRPRKVALIEDGREVPPFETRSVYVRERRRRIWRKGRAGVVTVAGDCVVAVADFLNDFGGIGE